MYIRRSGLSADSVKRNVGLLIFVILVLVWRINSWKAFTTRQGIWFSGLWNLFSWVHWGAKLLELLLSLASLSPKDQFPLMGEGASSKHTRLFQSFHSLDGLRGSMSCGWASWMTDNFYHPLRTIALQVAWGTSLTEVFKLWWVSESSVIHLCKTIKSHTLGIYSFNKCLVWIYFQVLKLYFIKHCSRALE